MGTLEKGITRNGTGFRDSCLDGSGVRHVGRDGELRSAGCDSLIQRGAVAAEHGHDSARFRQDSGDRAADAASAAGDERMRRTRQF